MLPRIDLFDVLKCITGLYITGCCAICSSGRQTYFIGLHTVGLYSRAGNGFNYREQNKSRASSHASPTPSRLTQRR